MLNKLIDAALKNRVIILLILFMLIVVGIFLLPNLNLDAFPDVTNVQVTVNTEAPGLAAAEVEKLITYPIEAVMYALPDVKEVRSISKTGLSVITIVFKDGVNIYFARQQVFQRLQMAKQDIPDGVGNPQMGPNTSGLGQIMQYVLLANPQQFNAMQLRSLNDYVVKPLLMPIPGITDVLAFGGQVRQYQVLLNPYKLLSYHLSESKVIKAIKSNNRNAGGWFVEHGQQQYVVRGLGWLPNGKQGLHDIANIPLQEQNGTVVRIKNVGNVVFGSEIRQGAVTMMQRQANGQFEYLNDVVSGVVLKRIGANSKATIDAIQQRLPLIQQTLPKGVKIKTIYDQASLISKAVNTVVDALLQAFVFIFIVLLLFLANIRSTLLVILSIPLSIGLALLVMAAFGMSANLMSLGGLAIAIGMLVDAAVVVMDNIFQQLAANSANTEQSLSSKTVIAQAVKQVARPVLFAILIILVVFAPLFSLQGVAGKLFQPMAISIVLAMCGSLLVAFFVIPVLASFCFKRGITPRGNRYFDSMSYAYQKSLQAALAHPKKIIAAASILFIITLLILPFIGREFVPQLEEGVLNVRATLASSASLATATQLAKSFEQSLIQFPEVTRVVARIGRPELGGDPEPVSNIELLVSLKPFAEWRNSQNRQHLQQQMAAKLDTTPGVLFSFSQPIATRVDELLSGVKAQLAIKLYGPDLEKLAHYGQALENIVRHIKGTRDVALEPIYGEQQLLIIPKREKLMRYGIAVGTIMNVVRDEIGGARAGQIIHGNERYDIYVRLAKRFRDSEQAIGNLIIQSPHGAWLKLHDLANIRIAAAPPQIRRDDVKRRVVIQANIEGRAMGDVVSAIQQAVAKQLHLPSGYHIIYGGQFKNQQRAEQRLMMIVPVALLLIFVLLYFAFGSIQQALIVMLNVPFALIGGILALWLSGLYLSLPGAVGFIALFGIAILNGVVLVNAINQNVVNAMPFDSAILHAAQSRLRPVLMTALTTLCGLLPLLYARGIGAEIQRPLATVVIGGLVSSTLLTLYVLPVLMRLCQRQRQQN